MKEITVQELKDKIDNGEQVFILDVRQPHEQHQSDLDYDNKLLIPLGDLPKRMDEIESHKQEEVVCLCRSGARSAKACQFLTVNGFGNAVNLKGGINQWARDIDPDLPIY